MIVGCGEWGLRALPIEEHFCIAERFDFQFLEIGIGGGQLGRLTETPTRDEIRALQQLVAASGVQTPFCCLENDFTLPDRAAHEAMVQKTIRQAHAAAECGATHVRLFAGFTPLAEMTEPRWRQMLDAFATLQENCAPLGLTIAVETHGAITTAADGAAIHHATVTTDRAALARLLHELPAEIGFNYDPGNLKAANPDDPQLCLDLLNERINYCHLKDWRRRGAGWEACAIGDDDLDYAPLLAQMQFAGVYLIEYEPLHDPIAGIERSLAYLKRIAPSYVLA